MYMFNSSLDNEDYITKYAEKIGKDVIATVHIGGVKVVPYEGGVDLTNIICTDAGGMIPDFIKKIVAKRTTENARFLVNFLMKGTVPD